MRLHQRLIMPCRPCVREQVAGSQIPGTRTIALVVLVGRRAACKIWLEGGILGGVEPRMAGSINKAAGCICKVQCSTDNRAEVEQAHQ